MKIYSKLISSAVAAGFLLTAGTASAQTLVDHSFDGVANDTGGLTFQQVNNTLSNGESPTGSADLATGVITTGTGAGIQENVSAYGFNTGSAFNVSAAAPAATGFTITFHVADTTANVGGLVANGLFFGVVTGTDANGTGSDSLWNNNPHAFGYVAGSGTYGNNVMRQDAQGGGTNDANSLTTALGGTAPSNASFQDGFTITIGLYNDDTWTITSTGLSTDLNGSGSLATGTGMLDYSAIAADLTPYVSLQGEAAATITIDQITITAVPEPSAFALLAGCFGLTWVMLRRRS